MKKESFSKDEVHLTVVIPCLNEAENISKILQEVNDALNELEVTSEIIVVDDQSDDETYDLAESWKKSFDSRGRLTILRRDLKRRGYGAVVRHGTAHGLGKYCTFVSADGVDPIRMLGPMLLKADETNASIVQCSRYINRGDDKTIPFKYQFFQFFFRRLVRLIFRQNIPDSTYAFKVFNRAEALSLGMTQNRFSVSPELTFKALLAGKNVEFLPGAQGTRELGESKFRFTKEGPGYLYCLIRAALHKSKVSLWF